MRLKKLLLILVIAALAPLSVPAGEPPSINGIFYRVPGQEYKFDVKSVEVIEFMSFYCGHCYNFEKSIPVIKGNFPKKVKWRMVPIYWGAGSPKPGEAYLLAEEAGKGEQMKAALFHASFVEKKDIGSMEVLDGIAANLGFGFDFSRRLRAGEKAKDVQKAFELAKAYGINETPTVVIAGNLMTDLSLFDHNMDAFRDNAVTVIRSILKPGK
ncbi:MAG: DsbA family protein [Deltaproteobacteria bacterium]|nr:DsbA family protein [Deltaproteobacteria bacterium]